MISNISYCVTWLFDERYGDGDFNSFAAHPNGTSEPSIILNFDKKAHWINPKTFSLQDVIHKLSYMGKLSGRKKYLHLMMCRV